MTDTFQFEYTMTIRRYGTVGRDVKFVRTEEGIRLSFYDVEVDAEHLMKPQDFAAFNRAFSAAEDADVIDVARAAVADGKAAEVASVAQWNSTVLHTWYDWDSDFYGFGQADSNRTQPTPYNY